MVAPMSLLVGAAVLLLALVVTVVATHRRQSAGHREAWAVTRSQVRLLAPRLPPALVLGECLGRLLPEALIAQLMGAESGLAGVALATGVGLILPGGPMVALPLAMALAGAGAAAAALVALITAWSLLALNRVFIFEAPVLGWPFTLHRLLVSLPLPAAAGLAAGMATGGGWG